MKTTKLKIRNLNSNYTIVVGKNILNQIPKQIKTLCPGVQKIALVTDKNVPKKFKIKLKKYLKNYKIYTFEYTVSEKFKSFLNVSVSFDCSFLSNIFLQSLSGPR